MVLEVALTLFLAICRGYRFAEHALAAWKADALPLGDSRLRLLFYLRYSYPGHFTAGTLRLARTTLLRLGPHSFPRCKGHHSNSIELAPSCKGNSYNADQEACLNKNVVRIQTEMFKPGAIVRGPMADMYLEPPPTSVWWPKMPHAAWIDDAESVSGRALQFEEGGFLFTFAALGTEINGHSNGDIDHLLQSRSAADLFRPDLASRALMSRDRFESLLPQACWAMLAVYEVDVTTGKVDFYAQLTLEELADEATGAR